MQFCISSGESESKQTSFPVGGWIKPNVFACRAWRGHILKQFSTNCLYLLKLFLLDLSPPYSQSLNKGC